MLLPVCFISCRKPNPYLSYQPVSSFGGTIYDYLHAHPADFNYMLYVLDKAGLTTMLQQDTLTFFMPTDNSLMAAMDEYNAYRQVQGKTPVTFNNIDSSSWRSILEPYLIRGELQLNDFTGQDGLMMTTLARRPMHGELIKHNASGVKESGSETVEFSYPNGSRFTIDWISAYVSTSNIKTKNGIIHILENRHVLGFNYFIYKAKQPQNKYSEGRTFSTGTITAPNDIKDIWGHYIKELKAVDSNTVETEAVSFATLAQKGFVMRLTVHDNDSITVRSAPSSVNATIQNDGPCFFDPVNFEFTLNYSYIDFDGKHTVNETIRYIAVGKNTY